MAVEEAVFEEAVEEAVVVVCIVVVVVVVEEEKEDTRARARSVGAVEEAVEELVVVVVVVYAVVVVGRVVAEEEKEDKGVAPRSVMVVEEEKADTGARGMRDVKPDKIRRSLEVGFSKLTLVTSESEGMELCFASPVKVGSPTLEHSSWLTICA